MIIDINCDMGESYGRFQVGNDKDIMPYISSCNIACGMHGGDPTTIINTINLAVASGKKVGAHPSYPDLMGFGRRSMELSTEELYSALIFQISSLYTLTARAGTKLHHVKVHGALYNDAAHNAKLADCVLDAITYIDSQLYVFTLPDSVLSKKAKERNIKVIHEAFADRQYTDDLRLQSRRISGAVIEDPKKAAMQAFNIAVNKKVTTTTGNEKYLDAGTICIHGDTSTAIEIAKTTYKAFIDSDITIG